MGYKHLLFTTIYQELHEGRQGELAMCLESNIASFDEVRVLSDTERPGFGLPRGCLGKMVQDRQTFKMLLNEAREIARPGDITVIANCDIQITRSHVELLDSYIEPHQAYCLNRWEDLPGNGMSLWDVEYGQDTWAFRGPPREHIGGDYYFGLKGCDNRFAHELDAAGYEVLNPSRDIKTYHLHASNKRTATNTEAHRVPPPYLYIKPHHLGETPEIKRAATFEQRRRVIAGRRRA